jgi:hypothetical protein
MIKGSNQTARHLTLLPKILIVVSVAGNEARPLFEEKFFPSHRFQAQQPRAQFTLVRALNSLWFSPSLLAV